ncbi:hypothetical protein [Clostridium sp. SM-530-WT-3G]|uniref:hypothetical protein n=1 Tax=Clostridium sp. SM-530-WT-3G TaxID=2725303 RepID=UPI00145E57D2|nr:hypothetical protein [Clostridium sp. SM-530-WT-3G]NME82140.1 hypothetical protein [Clostridium sp. SM-530-WT-3G]
MNINWKDRLFLKLTSGRFLISIAITIGFVILSVEGKLSSDYTNIFLIIVTFYFSKESQRRSDNSKND